MEHLGRFRQRAFIPFLCLLSTTTLTASPRGNHSEIIIGIQFGFVNVDRALLHSDAGVRLKWSSAFSRSVASLSSKLLSSASADRRASHSSLKRLFFFFAHFLSEERSTAFCPWPNLLAPSLGLGWIISSLYSVLKAPGSMWLHQHGWNCANACKTSHRFSWTSNPCMKVLKCWFSVPTTVFNQRFLMLWTYTYTQAHIYTANTDTDIA